jgi:2-hydroxycyclohexanecarboxyl-CoA dehydrogenase
MDLKMKGKVAMVTGGASDLGSKICLQLANEGVNVAIADIAPAKEKGEALAETLRGLGVKAIFTPIDVTKPDVVQGCVDTIAKELGPVDILVNAAAYVIPERFNVSTYEQWEKIINVCLYGVLNCTKAVIQGMIDREYGKIVNILGESGRVGEPRLTVTSAARGGVGVFTKALAKEVGRFHINVNGVALGLIQTSSLNIHSNTQWLEDNKEKMMALYPLKRLSVPDDIAPTVVYLASDNAGYITGQIVSVSGGYSMI